MIDLVKPINHPGHYGLGGFFLTAGEKSGKIYMMPGAIAPSLMARALTWPRATPFVIATDWGVTDATFVLTNAYNGFYTSTASSILNAFWRDNK